MYVESIGQCILFGQPFYFHKVISLHHMDINSYVQIYIYIYILVLGVSYIDMLKMK